MNPREHENPVTHCVHNADMAPEGTRRESRARHEKARHLRACGLTWAQIAIELDYKSRSAAQSAVERLQARERDSPDAALRSLVDGLMLGKQLIFEQLSDEQTRKNPQAVAVLTRELRATTAELARLDSLVAPQRVNVTVTQDVSERLAGLRQAMLAQLDEQATQAIGSSQGAAKYVKSERV